MDTDGVIPGVAGPEPEAEPDVIEAVAEVKLDWPGAKPEVAEPGALGEPD